MKDAMTLCAAFCSSQRSLICHWIVALGLVWMCLKTKHMMVYILPNCFNSKESRNPLEGVEATAISVINYLKLQDYCNLRTLWSQQYVYTLKAFIHKICIKFVQVIWFQKIFDFVLGGFVQVGCCIKAFTIN